MVNVLYVDMRNMLCKLAGICLAGVLFVACTPSDDLEFSVPDFSQSLTSDPILLSEDISFNNPYDLFSYKKYLVVVAYDKATKKCIHLYNKSNGRRVASLLFRGRGPRETMMGYYNASFDPDKELLTLFDLTKSTCLKVNLRKVIEGDSADAIEEIKDALEGEWIAHRMPFSGGTISIYNPSHVISTDSLNRIEIRDRRNKVLSSIASFPMIDPKERFQIYSVDRACLSDDQKTLAIATSYGSILEIFDIENGMISQTFTGYYVRPGIKLTEYGGVDTKENVYGFNDIDISGRNIFAAYDGEVMGKDAKTMGLFKNIAIWSVSGKAKKLIRTSYEIQRLTYDSKEQVLYLIVSDSNGTYLAKMEDAI